MDFNPAFFDENLLLRSRRWTEYNVEEKRQAFNGLIYGAYFITLMMKNGKYSFEKYLISIKRYYAENKDFSHDDMTGVVSLHITPEKIKWSRYWYRTEAFLYLFRSGHKWARLFFPLLSLKMIYSCATKNKSKNGSWDTDGPLLAWVIYENFPEHFKNTAKICNYFLKKHFGDRFLEVIFEIKFAGNKYSTNEDHPNRILSRMLYQDVNKLPQS